MLESIFFNPWIWILPILILVAIILIVIEFLLGWEYIFFGVFGGFMLLILAAFYFGFVLPPYDGTFYQTYRITGQVTQFEAAFDGDEGTMSQVFIARVDGVDEFIRSNDQRFRTIEVGMDVDLVCSKRFKYFQEPWYDCAFGGAR